MQLVPHPDCTSVNGNHQNKSMSRIYPDAATPYFGPGDHVSVWVHQRECSGGAPCPPKDYIFSRHCLVRVWVLFSSHFPCEIDIFHITCITKIDYCEPAPLQNPLVLDLVYLWWLDFLNQCWLRLNTSSIFPVLDCVLLRSCLSTYPIWWKIRTPGPHQWMEWGYTWSISISLKSLQQH